ncbi:14-3-3 protein [Histomonas meleagridis]|uniref:14-3-3 protein n=1 Tax=Histomonas meleagridis TaxID=135588 RepID=UPI003559F770|nr:14-3-3 protein [Histomonas meleagridis]
MAKVAQECGKNEECISFMREIIYKEHKLSYHERNLLNAAYKGIIGPLRNALTLLQDESNEYDVKSETMEISQSLIQKCDEAVALFRDQLLPYAKEPEIRIFYGKIIADFLRYKWEGTTGREQEEVAEECKDAYDQVVELTKTSLPVYHPLRLELFLNFSVFTYEVLGDPVEARNLAISARSDAESGLDQLSNESKEEAIHAMELLRENIAQWEQ